MVEVREQMSFALVIKRTLIKDGVIDSHGEIGGAQDEVTIEKGFRCVECDAVSAEVTEGDTLYECASGCGGKFLRSNGAGRYGTMCPDCGNKFGTKVTDQVCAECGEGDVEEVEVVTCPRCEEVVLAEVWPQHMVDEHMDELLNMG